MAELELCNVFVVRIEKDRAIVGQLKPVEMHEIFTSPRAHQHLALLPAGPGDTDIRAFEVERPITPDRSRNAGADICGEFR